VHICDGAGACAAVRFLKGWRIPRITGGKLFFSLLKVTEDTDPHVFLFGAKPERNKTGCERLRHAYPRLQIAGRLHGYYEDEDEIVRRINASRADILFVALAFPRQERWLGEHLEAINVPFCVGVEGSYGIVSGHGRRPPEIFQSAGTDSLYRLICAPRRWRRRCVPSQSALQVPAEAFSPRGLNVFAKASELRSTRLHA
jgi:N-acetylglucosaminyldiphosphoundecaprenol N-acetyl-beta-D-mannosaminyltransferase